MTLAWVAMATPSGLGRLVAYFRRLGGRAETGRALRQVVFLARESAAAWVCWPRAGSEQGGGTSAIWVLGSAPRAPVLEFLAWDPDVPNVKLQRGRTGV